MIAQRSLTKSFLCVALFFGLQTLTGCQTPQTETYGGGQRKADAPSAETAKHEMATTKSRANKDMAAVLTEFEDLKPKPIIALSAEEARAQPTPADAVAALLQERKQSTAPMPIGKTKNQTISGPGGDIPIRIYFPQGNGPFPVIVYFHGGGWVIATIDTYDSSARALAKTAAAIVVSVEYRKAPEHKFPAAHEDAYAAYQWVLRNADSFGGDPSMVAVAGESAGGNLAAAVCLMARARGELLPVHQALIYPIAGYDFNTLSYRENAHAKPLDKSMMAWFFEKYLREPTDGKHPWIDLVNARDVSGLPPATIITAEIDPLRSEGKRYAERLLEAGVPVSYQNFKGVTHEFFGMGAVVGDAKKAVRLVANGMNWSFDDPVFSRYDDRLERSGRSAQIEPLQE
ncbi:MAG TPA: alpha/beta hydrolase [Nitrospira sp.]|nr:alpha/beta hydrolase [Nitrospira sp.]